ncbi:MAG: U32 family peptidase, partial [Eggerthellaceae bacterium]|nr:U32 family peptidase [Eggerthellaceae bacterium]
MIRRFPELLAPAGNAACLHAAVSAGADAVYLGIQEFNARRGAENFSLESLKEACDYAHLRNVSIYLTLNTLALPTETGEMIEAARQAWRAGVDAFIVADIGVANELARVLPQARIHASTQMNVHTLAGIEAAQRLGAKRVTLARELSLPEVAALATAASELGVEVEVFAHGALCVCYSGLCLMSSMIGGRSANRGLCAQACRLPYSLHNVALRKTLPAEGPYLLSPKDLNTIDLIPELIAAGVSSLKIEGRMKSPEYVFTVTSLYRKALDAAQAKQGDGPLGQDSGDGSLCPVGSDLLSQDSGDGSLCPVGSGSKSEP